MPQLYDVDIQEFLKLTNGGLQVASFVQIKTALINRYKSVYGEDIDVSTASADGVFVNDLALIINNILQTVSNIYANLDVDSASGKYLDILCKLSNISRKRATRSNTTLLISNLSSNDSVTLPADIKFIDNAGAEWELQTKQEITLAAGEVNYPIQVVCSIVGAVEAPADYINKTIDASLNISIAQPDDAFVGENVESDSALRARRAQSTGAEGTTVLESLIGAIREISGIEDCKIYNATASSITANDGTVVSAHSIYVLLRRQLGAIIADETIGSLIYEKLTPGITTVESSVTADSKSYEYVPTVLGVPVTNVATQPIYWKDCTPIKPSITVTITPSKYFDFGDFGDNSEFATIAKAVMNYMNGLQLGITPSNYDIISEVIYADPGFKGANTYKIESVNISSLSPHDTFYNYTTFSVDPTTLNQQNYAITIE